MPSISVVVMFGVLMLQLASISTVDGCVHPGGCVSCGIGNGKSYRLIGDENAARTLNDYVISQLGDGDYIFDAGDGCDDVAEVLTGVVGWGDDTILGCSPVGFLTITFTTGDCATTLAKIQDLVDVIYTQKCDAKQNGCISCPVGERAIPQADDRALAALTDFVLQAGTTTDFSTFAPGANGGPGIFAKGGDIPCKEALPILAAQSSKDLYCSPSTDGERAGFIEGCDKPDAIAAPKVD